MFFFGSDLWRSQSTESEPVICPAISKPYQGDRVLMPGKNCDAIYTPSPEIATSSTRVCHLKVRRQLHVSFFLRLGNSTLWFRPLLGVGCPAAVDFVNRVIVTLGAKSPRRNGDGKM
jgi:hypothetical protein